MNYRVVSQRFPVGMLMITMVPLIIIYPPTILSYGGRTQPIPTHCQIMEQLIIFMSVIDQPIQNGPRYQTTAQNSIITHHLTVLFFATKNIK